MQRGSLLLGYYFLKACKFSFGAVNRDSIFNETHGSQKNAAKFIIVLTDGEIFLDPLTLDTVINSTEMVGIERYAIGVSSKFCKAVEFAIF